MSPFSFPRGKEGNCLISYRAGAWHYRIFADFLKFGGRWLAVVCVSNYCIAL